MTRRGGADTWLVAGGILMMLVGIALVVVPTFLPQYGWVVRSLANRGVTSLPIAIGGVLLCGIAFASRSNNGGYARVVEPTNDTSSAIEDLSQQIAHLGDGLQGMRIEFVYLKDALQVQLDRVQASASSDSSGDAVYRLAASLDQVGMRIEERVHAGNRDLGEALHATTTTLEGITKSLETITSSIEANAKSLQEDSKSLEALREESAQVRARVDELQTVPAPVGRHPLDIADEEDAWTREVDDDERDSRLGLLDMLDDLGRLLPRKTASVEMHTDVRVDPFESAQDEGWKQAPSIPSALPSMRGDELRIAEPAGLLGRGLPRSQMGPQIGSQMVEGALGDKLEELRGLLADSRVREALAALEKSRR